MLVNHVDLIVCAADRESGPGAAPGGSPWDRAAQACLDLPVRMIGANQFYEDLLGHIPIGTIDQAWYRYVLHPNFQSMEPLSKRIADVVLASADRDRHAAAAAWPQRSPSSSRTAARCSTASAASASTASSSRS